MTSSPGSLPCPPGKRSLCAMLLLAGLLAVLPAPAANPSPVTVAFRVDNDWGAAANITFTLSNTTATAISRWTLEFDYAPRITPYSHAGVASVSGNHQVLTNLSYAVIPASGTLSFQCQASPGGLGTARPVTYIFNNSVTGGTVTQSLAITTSTLPAAYAGLAYAATLAASGGIPPYTWALASGTLPAGITLGSGGNLAGIAASNGTQTFSVRVTDSATPARSTNRSLTLAVTTAPRLAINDVSLVLDRPTTNTTANSFLSTRGNQIIDAAGAPVRITGINWFGFETANRAPHGLWTRGYRGALDQIKTLGFNTLRLPFANEALAAGATTSGIDFSKNPDLQGLPPIQVLDRIVEYCGSIGLRIILDRHSARVDNYLNEDLWYIPGDATYTEQRWINDWVMLATRYAGNPTVIGADLFNEPKRTATWGNTAPATDWNKAAERCGSAILAANPQWLIIVEGTERYAGTSTWWGGNLKGAGVFPVVLPATNKLVYSMHDYPASVFAQTWFSAPNYPANLPGVWDGYWGYLFRNGTAPLLLGEFGSKLATASDQQWLDKLTDYIDGDFDLNGSNDLAAGQRGISWTFWCFNPNSGDTGGILNDDWTTVNQAKLGYLTASLAPLIGRGTGTNTAAAQTMTFTVSLSVPAPGPVSVAWTTVNGTAVAGTDFTGASGTVAFTAGQSNRPVSISIPPHTATGTRQFTVQLSNPSGATLADATGIGTILADRIPSLTIADAAAPEGNSGSSVLGFVVRLDGPATNAISVNYATANGTAIAGSDFTAASGTLVFNPGITQQTLGITLLGDAVEESDEAFQVTLSSPVNAVLARATATGTVRNDDITLRLAVNDITINEGNSGTTPATFTLSLNATSTAPVSVEVRTAPLTAVAGVDFLSLTQTVTFNPGQLTRTVTVGVPGNTNQQPNRTFALNLLNPAGAVISDAQGIATILDDDTLRRGKPAMGVHNYAEPLQKSLFFYEAQRAGRMPADNRVSWRGDAAVNDGADVGRDLTGGWFDAGDHVKFGLPMAASATLLAWAGIEYPAAFRETGQDVHLLDNLKWVCDYFLKCHVLDGAGNTLEFYGQVGNGSADHSFWGPPEVMTMGRPAAKVTRTAPGSDLTGETAAALAASSMLFRSSNPAYASNLLFHARRLYTFADTYRGKYSDSITDAQNYYKSWSGYQDELVWGALWLYRATGEAAYLDKARSAYNTLAGGGQPVLKWTHAWDDKTYGSVVLLSMLTTNAAYRATAQSWLDYWTVGGGNGRITYTPGGLAFLDTWGSLRYANNTAFLALIYSDRVYDITNRYRNFAISQVNYTLGSNPAGRSYVCGFGNRPPVNPHHRGAHGSWANNIQLPATNRHVLYGALVGGPGNTDNYSDARDNYVNNEVATDYNAGFTGALARMYELFGGYTVADFPAAETPANQFFVEASINQSGSRFTEIRALLNNQSAWPARGSTNLRFRYFIDLTELYAAGGSVSNVAVSVNTLSGGTITALQPWSSTGRVFYVEIRYDGVNLIPGGSTSFRREAQFRFTIPSTFPVTAWNPTNDWSYAGLVAGNQSVRNTGRIPTYEGTVWLEGTEPPSTNRARHLPSDPPATEAADLDGDGLPDLLEYALGLNPGASEPDLAPRLQIEEIGGRRMPVFVFTVNPLATGVALVLEESDDFLHWSPAPAAELSRDAAAGRDVVRLQLHPTGPLPAHLFLRLRATREP